MKIALSADHAGVDLKDALVAWLKDTGHDVSDLGTHGHESVDYPDYGARVARAVINGDAARGIAVCGSGIGISIAVNRFPGARCALVNEPFSAQLARQHNDANVLALGGRLTGIELAKACVTAFLTTEFEGGRHQHRVDKLTHELELKD